MHSEYFFDKNLEEKKFLLGPKKREKVLVERKKLLGTIFKERPPAVQLFLVSGQSDTSNCARCPIGVGSGWPKGYNPPVRMPSHPLILPTWPVKKKNLLPKTK